MAKNVEFPTDRILKFDARGIANKRERKGKHQSSLQTSRGWQGLNQANLNLKSERTKVEITGDSRNLFRLCTHILNKLGFELSSISTVEIPVTYSDSVARF
jgi:hypothetical protein